MYLLKSADQNLAVDTLPNKLKVALIRSDATAMPIISISVAAGHYHETTQCYGFSHLLEHMIFHRSENFDSSEALEKHVSMHSGYINGWTHACHTNFHLTCSGDGFVEAVVMLVDKIAHPSFKIGDIETEIAAIDEEYRLKLEDPVRGLFSVKKTIANPTHPFHRFTVGNRQTFEKTSINELQQQLRHHHQQYFHSGNISVCIKLPIAGNFDSSLQKIKQTLTNSIAVQPSNHALALTTLYLPEMTHKWINVRLKYAHCQLVMCWMIKKVEDTLDTHALSMIRQLMVSKHKNGLFDILCSKRLISAVALTGGIEQADVEEVQLHLTLTATGAQNKEHIIGIVTGYIDYLGRSQLANWRFTELEKQVALLATYANKRDPVETCIVCAQTLHADAATNNKKPVSFYQAKERITSVLGSMGLIPHHIYYIDEQLDVYQQSDFYSVPFSVSAMPTVKPEGLSHFMLSPQNTYLPAQLLLITPDIPYGTVEVINKHSVVLKFVQVIKKDQPCGDCFISINSPDMCNTLAHSMSKKVWVEGFTAYLQKRFYQADDAGISFRVYGHQHGLTIHTTGFSEKQLLLCMEIINCMIAFKLNQDEFEHVKQSIVKRLTTRLLQKPINQMFANLNTLIQGDTYSIEQQVATVKGLSFRTLNQHQDAFFQLICIEALMVGNWRLYAAQKMHMQLQSKLTAKGVWQKPDIIANAVELPCLPELPVIDAKDTAVVLYQQVRQLTPDFLYVREHGTAICLILEHILGPLVFLRLRNDKQLAYLVGVGFKPINMQPGIAIYLQSSKANAGTMYEAIVAVIEELLDSWEDNHQEMERIKRKVAEQCEPLNRDVSSIARRLWANYEHQDPFYHYQILQKAVINVSADEIKNWLNKLLHASEGQALLTNDCRAIRHTSLSAFTHRPKLN